MRCGRDLVLLPPASSLHCRSAILTLAIVAYGFTTYAQTVTLPAVADTYLKSGSPNQNQGSETLLRVQSSGLNRSLVRMDQEQIAAVVGSGTLLSAALQLYIADNGKNWGSSGRSVDAHRVTDAWTDQGATWNCANDTLPQNSQADCGAQWAGGSFTTTPSASVIHTNDLTGWVSFDVTTDVQAFLGGTANNGWLIKKTNETQSGMAAYTSRDGIAVQRPRLVLTVDALEAVPPTITITQPNQSVITGDPQPGIAVSYTDNESGIVPTSLHVRIDSTEITMNCTVGPTTAACTPPSLAEGRHTVTVDVQDRVGNVASASFSFDVFLGAGPRTVTLEAAADTYVRSGSPNQNEGSGTFLRIRSSGDNRALVRFDQVAIATAVGSGPLFSARLELYIERNGNNWGSSGRSIEAHRVTIDWSEPGATWNCGNDADPGNSQPDCPTQWEGGSFAPNAGASTLHTNGQLGWVQFDLTGDVLAFLDGTPNLGWIVLKTDEGQSGLVEYTSSQGAAGHRPRLVIAAYGTAGGQTPTATRVGTDTPTSTTTPTRAATAADTPTATASATVSATPTVTPSPSPTPTRTATPSHTRTPTAQLTATRTPTPTRTITVTPSPTATSTETSPPTATATARSTCPQFDVASPLPVSIAGTTAGAPNLVDGASCGDGGNGAADATYALTAPADGLYVITTAGSSLTTILSVRDGGCWGPELACQASDSEVQAHVEVNLIAGQTIVIVVDAYSGYSGSYYLSVQGPPPIPTPTPTPGDCCIANGTAGCAAAACAECICAADPFCCTLRWDILCAEKTAGECAASCFCATTSMETPMPTLTSTPTATHTHTPVPSPQPIIIDAPRDGSAVNMSPVLVRGYVAAAGGVVVNGVAATLIGNTFAASIDLVEGVNTITAITTSAAGSASHTIHVTFDTTAPAAPDVQLIATGLRTGAPATVVGFAGSVEPDSFVTVTNSRTQETVTAAANHSGEFVIAVTAEVGDTLSVVVTDWAGNIGPSATKKVGNVIVNLTETMRAATVPGGEVTVRGTFVSVPNGTVGVSIDGTPGLVEGNQFIARLPVDPSTTTVTLKVRDFSGVLGAVALPIAASTAPLPPAIVLRPTHPAGLIPVRTGFAYSSPVRVAHVALDADGDGTTDADETTLDSFTFTYTQPGLYVARLTVTDPDGNVYMTVAIVHAADPAAMDARLQPVWRGVKDALRGGDTSAAAQFIHTDTRASYDTVWSVLPAATLANIDQIMTEVHLLEVSPATAEFEMWRDKNGQTYSFGVWFQLDHDGLWRLMRF